MGKAPLREVYGHEENFTDEQLQEEETIRNFLEEAWTASAALVQSYDFENQRVDVLLRSYDERRVVTNVPIASSFVRSFDTVDDWNPGDSSTSLGDFPSAGMLLYPKRDGSEAWRFEETSSTTAAETNKPPGTTRTLSGIGPVFIPGVDIFGRPLPELMDSSTTETETQLQLDGDIMQKGDEGLVGQNGQALIFTDDGDIVLKGRDILFGNRKDSVSDYKAVARDGDSVSNPDTADGTVQASTTNVQAG